jgi:predicted ATPase with chaperone activity
MPRKEGVKYLPITLADEAQEQVKSVATAAGYKSAADYVRDLIKKDMTDRGIAFDDGITQWGKGRKKTPVEALSNDPVQPPKSGGKKKTE